MLISSNLTSLLVKLIWVLLFKTTVICLFLPNVKTNKRMNADSHVNLGHMKSNPGHCESQMK